MSLIDVIVLLVLLAVKQWRGRPRGDDEAALPKWMQSIDNFGPPKALGAPVILYFVLGERSRKPLDELKSWMAANNTVIMAVLTLIIGAKLIGDGISSL